MTYALSFHRSQRLLYGLIVALGLLAIGCIAYGIYGLAAGNRCFAPPMGQETWFPALDRKGRS